VKRTLILVALAACGGDLDPPWQLDHDRIIAVRATPPAILPGEQAEIDGLLAVKGGPTVEQVPELVGVLSPMSLASAVAFEGGKWVVTAPDEAALAAARTELELPADAPVPLQLGVSYAGQTLVGLKSVRLGATAENPTMPVPMVAGAPAPEPGQPIVIDAAVETVLSIEVPVEDEINWLTSCGEMHDFDLPQASIDFEADSPHDGELARERRDETGGVVWQVWPISATGTPPP
jgi:hypothetical protein